MLNIIHSSIKKVPFLILDKKKGLIELRGSSIMEDPHAFYDPVMAWIYDYVKNPKDTLVNIDLEYFNTSSAKILLILFKALSKINKSGFNLEVNWHYDKDDDDIRDTGHNFAVMSNVKFNFLEKNQI